MGMWKAVRGGSQNEGGGGDGWVEGVGDIWNNKKEKKEGERMNEDEELKKVERWEGRLSHTLQIRHLTYNNNNWKYIMIKIQHFHCSMYHTFAYWAIELLKSKLKKNPNFSETMMSNMKHDCKPVSHRNHTSNHSRITAKHIPHTHTRDNLIRGSMA